MMFTLFLSSRVHFSLQFSLGAYIFKRRIFFIEMPVFEIRVVNQKYPKCGHVCGQRVVRAGRKIILLNDL